MRQRSNANTSAKIWSAEYSTAADTGVVVKATADQPFRATACVRGGRDNVAGGGYIAACAVVAAAFNNRGASVAFRVDPWQSK